MEQTAKRRRKRKSTASGKRKNQSSRLTKSKTRSRSLFRSLPIPLSHSLSLYLSLSLFLKPKEIIIITRSRGPNKKTCSIKQVLLRWPNLMVSGCRERENLMFYLLCYLLHSVKKKKITKSHFRGTQKTDQQPSSYNYPKLKPRIHLHIRRL